MDVVMFEDSILLARSDLTCFAQALRMGTCSKCAIKTVHAAALRSGYKR